MNICEGCIKQDVCKFREEIEKDTKHLKIAESLEITCKYKEVDSRDECHDNPFWGSYWPPNITWTDGDATTTCGKEW